MIESLKVVAAITLFSLVGLTTNRVMLSQGDTSRDGSAKIFAAGYAQQVLDEITTHDFDEATVGTTVDTTTDLTLPASFGLDTGESSVADADDIDDYHNYQDTFTSDVMDSFRLRVDVRYMNGADLTPLSGSNRSWLKEIRVTAWNNLYIVDSVRITYLSTYYE